MDADRYYNKAIIGTLLLVLPLFFSVIADNIIYLALDVMFVLLIFNVAYPDKFLISTLYVMPFTFIGTVFFYNTELFSENYKIFASIKLVSFILLPVIIYVYPLKKIIFGYKLTKIILLYLFVTIFFYFVGYDKSEIDKTMQMAYVFSDVEYGHPFSNIQQMIPFVLLIILGIIYYQFKVDIKSIENAALFLSVMFIFLGVIFMVFKNYLGDVLLSPRRYSIESMGMLDYQFIGDLAVSNYSFLFHDLRITRLFSVFMSGIGFAYFLATAVIISLYRKKYFILLILLTGMIATLTRATVILLFLSYGLTMYMYNKNKRSSKILPVLFLIVALSVPCFMYRKLFIDYIVNGVIDLGDYSVADQSAAAHVLSVLVLFNILSKNILGYGLSFNSGESYLVDVIARTGIFGFIVFAAIFVELIRKYIRSHEIKQEYKIATCLVVFNLLGAFFSRESFTVIVSYMSWIYIGYVYAMICKTEVA